MHRGTRLILASTSPRRRSLFGLLGLEFQVVEPAGVDETRVSGSAYHRSQELARRKAEWVLGERRRDFGEILVVAADTLIALEEGGEERVFGKPRDLEHARRILCSLSGKIHRVVTGVALASTSGSTQVEAEVSLVSFRSLKREEIEEYLESGKAEGKAGAYGIQDEEGKLVASVRGCYYNVVGLPLGLLASMLQTELDPRFTCDCRDHPLQQGLPRCKWQGSTGLDSTAES